MVVVPTDTVVITPVVELMVATPGTLLVQVPPGGVQERVPGLPHTSDVGPLIAPAVPGARTVIVIVEVTGPQAVGTV